MSTAARSEDQEQPPVVPVFSTAAITFVPDGATGTTVGAPVTLPGPSNGVHLHTECPDCGPEAS